MSLASEKWNELPEHVKRQAHGILLEHTIRDLFIDRQLVERKMSAILKEMDDRIKRVELSLLQWESEMKREAVSND